MAEAWKPIFHAAASIASRRHATSTFYDRDDLYQEAAAALVRHQPDDFGLAITIARRATIDFLRRKGRYSDRGCDRGTHHELTDEFDRAEPDDSEAVDDALERRWRVEVVNTAIRDAQLPGRQVDVLDRILAGQAPDKIAADLGITRATVDTHKHLALKRIKAALPHPPCAWCAEPIPHKGRSGAWPKFCSRRCKVSGKGRV